jgi:hypothetical protein
MYWIAIVYGAKRTLANTSKADFTQNPLWLELSIKGSKQVLTLKSLLRFVSDNTLQWQVFDTETKPVSFRYDKGTMLFLKKVEQLSN